MPQGKFALMGLTLFTIPFLPQATSEWTFDTFGLARACKGSPLRFMGYELLTRHGCLHKYKVKMHSALGTSKRYKNTI